jgi:hypothetical protein
MLGLSARLRACFCRSFWHSRPNRESSSASIRSAICPMRRRVAVACAGFRIPRSVGSIQRARHERAHRRAGTARASVGHLRPMSRNVAHQFFLASRAGPVRGRYRRRSVVIDSNRAKRPVDGLSQFRRSISRQRASRVSPAASGSPRRSRFPEDGGRGRARGRTPCAHRGASRCACCGTCAAPARAHRSPSHDGYTR